MGKARKIAWRGAVLAAILLFLSAGLAEATTADQAARMLGISRDTVSYSSSGEEWVDETWKILHKSTEKIGVPEMIKIGAPLYYHIMSLAEREQSFAIFPELVAAELSKVAEYCEKKPKFDAKSERNAKRTLIKAASYLPSNVISRIPALEAYAVVGRGLFRQYACGRVVIKTTGVKISLHELGHVFERSADHLLRLRTELYESRTQGKPPKKLNPWRLPFGYRPDEEYRSGFVDRYMGKEGGVEVYSCGIEYVFFNNHDIWHRDPEVTKFILGSLIFYGNRASI